MNLNNVFILVFLLAAFGVGVALQDSDRVIVDSAINNGTMVLQNISLDATQIEGSYVPNLGGLFRVLEEFIQFIGVLFMEILRAGIYFGQDNPGYFSPEFIISLAKFIVVLAIISLIIKPLFYLGIILVLSIKWIFDKRKGKNKKNERTK